jgi:DNA-binding XRE family transcriptional regulator
MDPVRFGADVRLLRGRKSWSQLHLAHAADVPRWVITAIEAGRGDTVPPIRLSKIVRALGGVLSVRIHYQGEGLDRLRDRRHAGLVEQVVARLRADGWAVATEVSFSVYGERGSIDVLASHPPSRALLVIEVKSVVPDVGGMLMTLDRKVRLSPGIAREQLGWESSSVSKLLVLPEERTARRRVTDHRSTFDVTFPDRNVVVKRWLRAPSGTPTRGLAGILFLPDAQHVDRRRRSDP